MCPHPFTPNDVVWRAEPPCYHSPGLSNAWRYERGSQGGDQRSAQGGVIYCWSMRRCQSQRHVHSSGKDGVCVSECLVLTAFFVGWLQSSSSISFSRGWDEALRSFSSLPLSCFGSICTFRSPSPPQRVESINRCCIFVLSVLFVCIIKPIYSKPYGYAQEYSKVMAELLKPASTAFTEIWLGEEKVGLGINLTPLVVLKRTGREEARFSLV